MQSPSAQVGNLIAVSGCGAARPRRRSAQPKPGHSGRRLVLAIAATLLGGGAAMGAASTVVAGRDPVRIGVLSNANGRGPVRRAQFEAVFARAVPADANRLEFVYRSAQMSSERLAQAAEELVGLRPRAIVCDDGFAARAVAMRSQRVPILFRVHDDPVASGLVQSLTRPGTNVTGVVTLSSSDRKLGEMALDAMPSARRLAYVFDPEYMRDAVEEELRVVRARGRQLVAVPISSADAAAARLDHAYERRFDAAIIPVSGPAWLGQRALIEWFFTRRVPALFGRIEFAAAGGLIGFGPDNDRADEQLADYFARLLMGANVGDLPVLFPDRHLLGLNLATARSCGFRLPRSFLRRVDRFFD